MVLKAAFPFLFILEGFQISMAENFDCGLNRNESCIDVDGGDEGTFSTVTESVSQMTQWLEMDVVAGFRAWQVMFLCIAGLISVVMFFCCVTNGRIPRTKQQIDADYQRKKLAKKFRSQLNKIQVEEMNLAEAIDKLRKEMPDTFVTLDVKNLMEETKLYNGDALSGNEDSDEEGNENDKPKERPNLGQILRKALMGLRFTRRRKEKQESIDNEDEDGDDQSDDIIKA